MRRSITRLAVLAGLLLVSPHGRGADLRCDDGLVGRGDLAVEVVDACGEPDLVDAWRSGPADPRPGVPEVEQWYYNSGPRKLVRILRIRNGRVSRIESGGYGFRGPASGDCDPAAVQTSMNKLRLLARCGSPVQRDSVVVYRRPQRGLRRGSAVLVYRETWIYNFGDNRLLREVRLENGRVVNVDTVGRGYDQD